MLIIAKALEGCLKHENFFCLNPTYIGQAISSIVSVDN